VTHRDDSMDETELRSRFRISYRVGLVLLGFFVIAGVLLLTEHRAHALGALIWLPLLLCPLMHVFMHGGHGGHGDPEGDQEHRTGGGR
jgi:hypothetical protein